MTDDNAPTPPRTPSAMQRLGLAVCPRCDGFGRHLDEVEVCYLCNGGGRVTLKQHHDYVGLHDTDHAALRLDVDPEEPE